MSPPPAVPEDVIRPSTRQWQARIIDTGGRICGSGVLISPRHVLTCAHVLAEGAEPPDDTFMIDFPRSLHQPPVTGKVSDGGWFPELPPGRQDIAILEFDDPLVDEAVVPARLHPARDNLRRDARVYGHPEIAPDGMWSRIEVTDTVGERVQLSGRMDGPGDIIAPGFSGGGVVLDEGADAVIGIVVTTIAGRDAVTAWMIPVEVVARYCSLVTVMLSPAHPAEPDLDPAGLHSLADTLSRFRHLAAPSDRQQIAERLPPGPYARLPHPPPTVWDLVRACVLPSELRVLADLVRYFDKDSVYHNRLEKQLEMLGVTSSDAPLEPEELNEASRRDLRDALGNLPYFRDAQNRHLHLDAFQRRVRNELHVDVDVQKSLDAVSDADFLVEICARVPGALSVLPKDFPAGEQDDPGVREVIVLIGFLTNGRMLLTRERTELLDLISAVPVPLLKSAHRRASPWTAGESAPGSAARIVEHVEGQAQRPGELPRALVFAEHLAQRDETRRTPLRAWTDRVAARHHLAREAVESLRQQLAETLDEAQPPVLTIQLTPDALQPKDRFLLSAVLDHNGVQRVIASSDDPADLDAVRGQVDGLLDDVHEALEFQAERLTVEVVVPRALLTERADRWDVLEAIPVPIGEKYPVVLRSYERLRQQRMWGQWGHKWQLAKEQITAGADAMHYVAADDPATARDVYEALSSDRKLALVLGKPPAEQAELKPYDAYAGALQAGVAYVVWIREVSLAEDFRLAMEQALADTPVRDLPALIAAWRAPQSGTEAPAELSRHIAIMACDYDRRAPFAARGLGSPRRRPS